MLRLIPADDTNAAALCALHVRNDQRAFVADNAQSLAEARTAAKHGVHAFPFGVYDDGTPVGFVMISFGVNDAWTDAPAIACGSYNIRRLMIDHRWQRRGYGREAMALALDFIRTHPCGDADTVWLSCEPENQAARALCRSFGFVETGDRDGDKVIAAIALNRRMQYFVLDHERRNTHYHEFQRGVWDGKSFWLPDSIALHDDVMVQHPDFVNALVAALPGYDPFVEVVVHRDEWAAVGRALAHASPEARVLYHDADAWIADAFREYGCFTIIGL